MWRMVRKPFSGKLVSGKGNKIMKRVLDILLALTLLLCFILPMALIALVIKLTSSGPVFHVSDRVGRDNTIFRMVKFRTMRVDTPQVATHLMTDPSRHLTPVGGFLRKTSLDELPQLINVLTGDMSFVGPRPALFNQDDLVALRTEKGVHRLVPGITGWAQTHGRDELPIPVKVEFDAYYLKKKSVLLDFKILCLTLFKVLSKDGVAH